MLHRVAFFLAIPLDQRGPVLVGDVCVPIRPTAGEGVEAPLWIVAESLGPRLRIPQGATLVDLGLERVDRLHFFVEDIVDGDRQRGGERVGPGEVVGEKEEGGIFLQVRGVGTEIRHHDHKGGVLNEQAHVAVVGVVVVGPVRKDEVGVPFPDQAGDGLAVLQRGQQLAIVDVEHLDLGAHAAGGFLDFRGAAFGELAPGHFPMPDVAVGAGDQFYLMPELRPLEGTASDLELRIVRVRAEGDDAERSVGGGGGGLILPARDGGRQKAGGDEPSGETEER